MRMYAATIYHYSYKGMHRKSILLAAHARRNRVVAYVIAIRQTTAFVLFTCMLMMGVGQAPCVVDGHFRKQKGFR